MALQIATVTAVVGSTNPTITPGRGIRIDGIEYTQHFGAGWQKTNDADAAFSSATFPVERPFTLSNARHIIELYAGWQGALALCFRGEIVTHGKTYWRRTDTLEAAGVLRRTQVGLNSAKAFYNSGGPDVPDLLDQIPDGYTPVPITTDASLIVHILESYGILPGGSWPDSWNHSIEASAWQPAMLSPILWDAGAPGWPIIEQLDRKLWRTFDGMTGAVYRRPILGKIPAGVRHTFIQGIDILDCQVNTDFNPYNQVRVLGAQIASMTGVIDPADDELQVIGIAPSGTPASSPYIDDPPGVRTFEYSNPYIETVSDADALAAELLGYLQEPTRDVTLGTFACSDFDVSNGLGLSVPSMNLYGNYFIIGHPMSGAPLRSQFKLRGSSVATPVAGNIAPVVLFTVTTWLQNLRIAGVLTQVTMVQVDARQSYDPDGTLASWSITVAGTTRAGSDIAQALETFVYTGTSPVAVTVSVTDNGGTVATIGPQSTAFSASTLPREKLVAAETTQAAATDDGEATWQVETGIDSTVVAPIALGSRVCFSHGAQLYSTDTMLRDTEVLRHTFPATITALWNNEKLTDRWLVGLSTGAVYLSLDNAVTWTLLANLGAAVNDISESPYAINQMTAAAGDSLRRTFDGTNWSAFITTSGATCLRFAAGSYGGVSKVYAGFSNGVIKLWRSDTGAVTTAATVAGSLAIRGLTLGIEEEKLTIGVAGTATYTYTPAGGLVAGPALNASCNYMIRSGIARGQVVYVASASEEGKLVAGSYYPFRLTGAERIGYGTSGTVATFPITPTTIVSAPGAEKVASAWNGSSNVVPPGWSLLAYPDDAWQASIAFTRNNTAFYSGPPAGSAWVTYSNNHPPNAGWLLRREFTLPAGTIQAATLVWNVDDILTGVWINGTFVTDASSRTSGGLPYGPVTVTVDPTLLTTGPNVLAMQITNGPDAPGDTITSAGYTLTVR